MKEQLPLLTMCRRGIFRVLIPRGVMKKDYPIDFWTRF